MNFIQNSISTFGVSSIDGMIAMYLFTRFYYGAGEGGDLLEGLSYGAIVALIAIICAVPNYLVIKRNYAILKTFSLFLVIFLAACSVYILVPKILNSLF